MVRTIAIIGGTGPEGRGLATRFVQAGRQVILGSRQAERARSAAAEVNEALGSSLASGSENAEAARSAQLVVLAIPFAGMAEAVKPLAAALSGKSVISTICRWSLRRASPTRFQSVRGRRRNSCKRCYPTPGLSPPSII